MSATDQPITVVLKPGDIFKLQIFALLNIPTIQWLRFRLFIIATFMAVVVPIAGKLMTVMKYQMDLNAIVQYVLYSLQQWPTSPTHWLVYIGLLVLVFGLNLMQSMKVHKTNKPVEYQMTSEAVFVKEQNIQTNLPWSAFAQIYRNDDCFYLEQRQDRDLFVVIPARVFPEPEQFEAYYTACAGHFAAAQVLTPTEQEALV